MTERCTETTYKIKGKEALRAPAIFEDGAEHPKGKHIGKEVQDRCLDIGRIAMHEHVSDELPWLEEIGPEVMEAEVIGKVDVKCTPDYVLRYCKDNIDDDEILYNRGYNAKAPRSVFGHKCKGGFRFRISDCGFRREDYGDFL
jgi:hypothetical protein